MSLARLVATAGCLACWLGSLGCAQPSPLERALAARGPGPGASTRDVEATVHYGFPGRWRWQLAYRPPVSFRLSVETSGAPQHYVFDGEALHSYLGSAPLTRDDGDVAAHRSIGRWLGITTLAILSEPDGFDWGPASEDEIAGGATTGIWLRLREDGSRYVLGFDAADRLVFARGPIAIPGVGAGRIEGRFSDHRRVGESTIPFAARYRLNDEPFFDEHVLRFLPGRGRLDPAPPPREDPPPGVE